MTADITLTLSQLIIALAILLLSMVGIVFYILGLGKPGPGPVVSPLDEKPAPTIIVNMPQDARPLEQLTNPDGGEPTIIGSDRAVLWWTVYKHAFDHEDYNVSVEACFTAANQAVMTVYGPPKP